MFSVLQKLLKAFSQHPRPPKSPKPEEKPEPEKKDADTPVGKSHGKKKKKRSSHVKSVKTGKKSASRPKKEAPPPQPAVKKSRSQLTKTVNKHGLPVLRHNADLSACFTDEPGEIAPQPPVKSVKKKGRGRNRQPEKPGRTQPKNRHGIPLFNNDTDFSVFFREEAGGPPSSSRKSSGPKKGGYREEENFEALLEESLAGKDTHALLQEKADALPPDKPLTKEEKIRGYPPPQEEIDLHGFNAQDAIDNTEAFIRKARQKGIRTVLIIVGKGIHSEGRAILPDVVENKIADLKRKNQVLAFEWERGIKRRSGAIIVYLRIPEMAHGRKRKG